MLIAQVVNPTKVQSFIPTGSWAFFLSILSYVSQLMLRPLTGPWGGAIQQIFTFSRTTKNEVLVVQLELIIA